MSFDETIKCLASGVFNLKVNLEHPTPVGSLHCWYTASILQATFRGLLARKKTAAERARRAEQRRQLGMSLASLPGQSVRESGGG